MVCANDAFLKLATPKTKIAQAGAAIIRQGRAALCEPQRAVHSSADQGGMGATLAKTTPACPHITGGAGRHD